MISHPNFRL